MWENLNEASNALNEELVTNAIDLGRDIDSVFDARNVHPKLACTTIALLFGYVYKVACREKGEVDNIKAWDSMVDIAKISADSFPRDDKCQAG